MKGIRLIGLAVGLALSWAAVVSGQDLWEQDKALQAAMTGPVDLWQSRLEVPWPTVLTRSRRL